MRWMRLGKVLMLGVLTSASLTSTARADILPSTVTIAAEGTNMYRYTYTASVESGSKVVIGDYFTIYDFAGYSGGVAMPMGWSLVPAMTPPTITPVHNTPLPDLTFQYVGGEGLPLEWVGPMPLGQFSALSIYGEATEGDFASRFHKIANNKPGEGRVFTEVPMLAQTPDPDPDPNPITPEPTTLALLGLGLPCVGLARWIRRRRA